MGGSDPFAYLIALGRVIKRRCLNSLRVKASCVFDLLGDAKHLKSTRGRIIDRRAIGDQVKHRRSGLLAGLIDDHADAVRL